VSKSNQMKLNTYVNYKGNSREAFQFYEKHLGGKIISMATFKELPDPANIPEGNGEDNILHARIEIGGAVVMGANIPNAKPMRSAYLTITVESAEEAERNYALLSEGKNINLKLVESQALPTGVVFQRFVQDHNIKSK